MPISKSIKTALALAVALSSASASAPAFAQTAVEAALGLANALDGARGGVSRDAWLAAMEDDAAAGRPIALWHLGNMYENGEGVPQDRVKAFSYFSQIVKENSRSSAKSLDADIVAQSLLKVGEYYKSGLPDAGIPADPEEYRSRVYQAASLFGDAEAQYRLGEIYLSENATSVTTAARWLTLAARKGHAGAQALLGDLLFNGEGIEPQPVEGLMWLNVAQRHAAGTSDEVHINELAQRAMAVATPDERAAALQAADTLSPRFGGY